MSAGGEGPWSLRARLAAFLLPSFLTSRERREIISDLEELQLRRLRSGGRIRAALWFTWEVLRSALVLRLNRSAFRASGPGRRPVPEPGGLADMLGGVGRDVRVAVRSYIRSPGASVVAITTLALGIGATTAIFSFADALLLRPLPVREPGRLVRLQHRSISQPGTFSSFSFPGFLELEERSEVLSHLAAFSSGTLRLGEGERSESVAAMIVSGNYFSTLGAEMALGRGFTPEEDAAAGTHPAAVLSYGLWERRFARDPSILGKDVLVNGHPFTVVGVASSRTPTLDLRVVPELWVPLMMYEVVLQDFGYMPPRLFGNRGTHWLSLLGRLEPGVSRAAAQGALQALAAWQAETYPREDGDWTIVLTPAEEARAGAPGRRPLVQATGLLAVVVGLVLLIACANVANILLARALARSREMGVRLAVGAGRGRLVRQVLTEALLLSMVGGAAGLLLATWAMRLIPLLGLTRQYPGLEVELDPRVLLFALGLTLLTGTVFGLIPALRATGEGLARLGRGGLSPGAGRGWVAGEAGGGRRWLSPGRWFPPRQSLLSVQVAISLILLIGAGLALRTLWNLRALPMGFEIENLHVATIELGEATATTSGTRGTDTGGEAARRYTEEEGRQIYQALVDRTRSLAGVQAAGLARFSPFSARRMADDFLVDGGGGGEEARRVNAEMNVVGPGYFQTMEIPVVRGRSFTREDQASGPGVVVVNQTTADRLWPGREPLGQRLRMTRGEEAGPELEVVGVVADGRYHRRWRSQGPHYLFLPLTQHHADRVSFLVRGRNEGSPSPEALERVMAEVTPGLPAPEITPLKLLMDQAIGLERTNARVLGLFALLALFISAMGVYGVVSFSVSQRTHEIGVRMAIGARPLDVGHVVIRESAASVLAGVVVGWGAALGLGRFAQTFLFDVPAADPLTFAATAAVLAMAGVAAALVPVRRATRLDPVTTLQEE